MLFAFVKARLSIFDVLCPRHSSSPIRQASDDPQTLPVTQSHLWQSTTLLVLLAHSPRDNHTSRLLANLLLRCLESSWYAGKALLMYAPFSPTLPSA